MADERDPQVSRRYRELGSEAPPPALDEAILAASRRAVAPRRRWYLPLAAAAVALLGIGIAVQVERQRPDAEAVSAPPAPDNRSGEASRAEPPAAAAEPKALKREAAREAPTQPKPERQEAIQRPSNDQARDNARGERELRLGESAAAPPIPQTAPEARARLAPETPHQWLERIADLRRQGRHEEADKALAEFRRRYPEYRIPDETLRRIEKE